MLHVLYLMTGAVTDTLRAQGCPDVHLCIVGCQDSNLHDNIRASTEGYTVPDPFSDWNTVSALKL